MVNLLRLTRLLASFDVLHSLLLVFTILYLLLLMHKLAEVVVVAAAAAGDVADEFQLIRDSFFPFLFRLNEIPLMFKIRF
jgi:hypothetical protein